MRTIRSLIILSLFIGLIFDLTPWTQALTIPPAGFEDDVRVNFDENPFADNNISTLEGIAAAELYRRAVIGGFPDGEFKGNRLVNRAEAAKFLLLSRKDSVFLAPGDSPFWDVIASEWYGPFVLKAASLGIIKGHPDGSFRPADPVLLAEFIKMLSLSFDLPTGLAYHYGDESRYPGAWFWDYAGVAQQYQLFPNSPNQLNPEKKLTRNEVAVAIYQYLKNRGNPIGVISDNWITFGNADLGFELRMPSYVSLDQVMNDQYNRLAIFTSEKERFEVRLKEFKDTSLNQIFYNDQPFSSRALLGGKEALVFVSATGYCDGPGCGSPSVAYVAKNGDDFYYLVFYGDAELSDTERLIVESFKFTEIAVDDRPWYCTDEPAPLSGAGGVEYPSNPKYSHIAHLAQLFTAYDCGEGRFYEVADTVLGNQKTYELGSNLWLDSPHNEEYIISLLQELGYSCSNSGCTSWRLDTSVDLEKLMKLRLYYEFIKSNDCINCG
ncbi:MAG: S-layer homology domain-containing protein [bacterium]|nr:S-layer homology domain-containing protein [bacterium]